MDLAALEQARLEAQARWEKARAGLSQSEAAAAAQSQRIDDRGPIAAVRAERDVKREALAQARLELAERRQKVEVLDRGLGEMERRREQIGELLVERQRRSRPGRARSPSWRPRRGTSARIPGASARPFPWRAGAGGEDPGGAGRGRAPDRLPGVRPVGAPAGVRRGPRQPERARGPPRRDAPAGHLPLAEEVAREFQADVAAVDWREMLWHADDEPAGPEPARPRRGGGGGAGPAARRGRSAPSTRARPTSRRSTPRTGTRSRPRSTRSARGCPAWAPSTSWRSRSTPSSSSATTS
jgi:chromosome segregation protein